MIDSLKSTDDIKNLRDSLKSEIGNNVVGLDKIIDSLVISILVGGHVLIEGFPGTGKTLIANLFSKSIESTSNRIFSSWYNGVKFSNLTLCLTFSGESK